jgi:hypothetical protein
MYAETHHTNGGSSMSIDVQSTDPGAVGANQLWVDKSTATPYQLKVRNAANDAWDAVGGSGGGNVITTGPIGSEPGSAASGDLYLPNNSYIIERYSGSNWAQWGPSFPFTPPVLSDFTWVNQGSATTDTTYGGVYLSAPGAGSDSLRILKKAAPSTPYTITIAMIPQLFNASHAEAGFVWRQSSNGALVTSQVYWGGGVEVSKWSSPNAYNSDYLAVGIYPFGQIQFLKMQDDGTNRIVSWSTDGQHWFQISSISRTDFITADEVGFFVNAANATYPAGMTLLSWEES